MNNKKHFLKTVTGNTFDLALGALVVARHFRPQLDIDHQLSLIDELASEAAAAQTNHTESLLAFFTSQGFRGNREDYYHQDNSLLDQVLIERKGIPISLAILYLAVIERLNIPDLKAHGVGFPGHFLLSVNHSGVEHLVDVFEGQQVTRQQCYQRITNHTIDPDPAHFNAATSHDILCRLLENLKVVYWNKRDLSTVLDCLDYQLMIFPERTSLLQQQHNLRTSISSEHRDQPGNMQLH